MFNKILTLVLLVAGIAELVFTILFVRFEIYQSDPDIKTNLTISGWLGLLSLLNLCLAYFRFVKKKNLPLFTTLAIAADILVIGAVGFLGYLIYSFQSGLINS